MIVGYHPMVFFSAPGFANDLLDAYKKDPLYTRAELWIYDQLASGFAFLDGSFTPINHLLR